MLVDMEDSSLLVLQCGGQPGRLSVLLVNPGSYFSLLIGTNTDGPARSGKVATFYCLNSIPISCMRRTFENRLHQRWKRWKQANQICSQWIPDMASWMSESHSRCAMYLKLDVKSKSFHLNSAILPKKGFIEIIKQNWIFWLRYIV